MCFYKFYIDSLQENIKKHTATKVFPSQIWPKSLWPNGLNFLLFQLVPSFPWLTWGACMIRLYTVKVVLGRGCEGVLLFVKTLVLFVQSRLCKVLVTFNLCHKCFQAFHLALWGLRVSQFVQKVHKSLCVLAGVFSRSIFRFRFTHVPTGSQSGLA